MKIKTFIFVFGTRPELIKLIPLILESRKKSNIKTLICSTGQHRDMLASLYEFFEIRPDIDFNLMRPNQNLTLLHAETMLKMANVIEEHKPDWVIVQGDTTSAHAAAMAAFYQKTAVAHVEAGLRTYDINSPFPEEMNRRAIGLVAKAHFCPTQETLENLKREETDATSIMSVTGNTCIDSLKIVTEKIENSTILKDMFNDMFSFLNINNFILATMHRRENFGNAQLEILKAFLHISTNFKIDILFPVHPNPNVRQTVNEAFSNELNKSVFWVNKEEVLEPFNLSQNGGRIFLINPIEYAALVFVMQKCRFVMTDSGGLQEEAPTFKKKIIILRNSTERPEGVAAGFSELVGTNFSKIINAAQNLLVNEDQWLQKAPSNPYGDGQASERIIKILINN